MQNIDFNGGTAMNGGRIAFLTASRLNRVMILCFVGIGFMAYQGSAATRATDPLSLAGGCLS
jgi:hypothetical protein